MDTYFAPPEKVTEKGLATEINIVSNDPVMSGLLHSISGLLAVMDEYRQIVALNDSLLKELGFDDPAEVLGLRLGEALTCVHAHDEPAGCGTTKFCSTCGAAIAIVSSLGQNKPVERICALSAKRGNKEVNLALLVKSHPIIIEKKRFLLLFIQDITLQEQRAALERTFFHDVNNMLSMLVGASEILIAEEPSKYASIVHESSIRLMKEVAIQRCLSQNENSNYQPMRHEISTKEILADLHSFSANHPAMQKKKIEFQNNFPNILVNTDISLLSRVLYNMTINALEASEENGVVKIWIEYEGDLLSFCVWNSQKIPQEITHRIFQRNFSTKNQSGRGIGTFSMKLFGEEILGGKVSFKTSSNDGTTFRLSLPV